MSAFPIGYGGLKEFHNPMDGLVEDFYKKQNNEILVGESLKAAGDRARMLRIKNKRDRARGKRKRAKR